MKILLLAMLFALPLLSADSDSAFSGKEKEIFKNQNDQVIENGTCSWQCREVNDGFATQVIGFDFSTGTTFCKVYNATNLDKDLGINANRQNKACIWKNDKQSLIDFGDELLKFGDKTNYSGFKSTIDYQKDDSKITFSKFLASLVTLNPNIIDRVKSHNTGEITLKDGIETYSVTNLIREGGKVEGSLWQGQTYIDAWNNAKVNVGNAYDRLANNDPLDSSIFSYSKTSTLDGFNKNNMAYFSSLFFVLEKIYQHIQIFIFVLVGGFFVMQIGANKLQAYLENRSENEGKQPYLHKFYIPLFMVAIFFMPIPEANGNAHSTVMQNIIRYFASYSTDLADMANAKMAKIYMEKIYKRAGGVNYQGYGTLGMEKISAQFTKKQSNLIYKEKCSSRYPYDMLSVKNVNSIRNYQMNESARRAFQNQWNIDPKSITGTNNDISVESCIMLEMQFREAEAKIKEIEKTQEGIEKFNNNIPKELEDIDKYFAERDKQLGWIDASLISTSGILIETFTLNKLIGDIKEYDIEKATKTNRINTQRAEADGDINASNDEANDSLMGKIGGSLIWMMFPPATSIKEFLLNIGSKLQSLFAGISFGSFFHGNIVAGATTGIAAFLITLGKTPLAYYFTSVLMEMTYQKIPMLVCATASLVAIVAYLVTLCKYFYISPFVVAWSMATKKVDKIIDFLVAGIAIFLKPMLIVIFIYLSLFISTLVEELFIFFAVEQFSSIKTSWYNFLTNFTVGAISGLLKIFGILASSYIIWKLIISGPAWTLSLVGIDGKQDDVIAQGIEQNLARRAFVA